MSEAHPDRSPDFYGLGIAPKILEILQKLHFTVPTPIQVKSIPVAIEGKDMIGIAQTGTGKTLAFGIPLIQRLAQVKGRGLIIVPTRELAGQVEESILAVGRPLGLRTALLIGGASMKPQKNMLSRHPHVIIATPGRLIDHLQQRSIQLHDVRILVLDEADRMLDMGFAPQIATILRAVPANRQTLLFSATMPPDILRMASRSMKLPVHVEIAPAGTAATRVAHEFFIVRREDKMRLLEKLLQDYRGSVLLFSRTKHGAKKIARALHGMGHRVAEIHSNRSLSQRRSALAGFKAGQYRVLVATDIAARGIDVKGIELVLNYDLPDRAADYVHRIGRTGRAGHEGKAVSFTTPDQRGDIHAIERLTRLRLPVSALPELPPQRSRPYEPPERQRHHRTRNHSRTPSRGPRYRR